MRALIPSRHVVIESVHPAARSHSIEPRFVDSKPFSRADAAVLVRNREIIGWSLPGDS